MTKLTKGEIKHFSELANLYLSSEEISRLNNDLNEILEFVNKLSRVNTSGINPLNNITGEKNVFRVDKVGKSLSQEQALSNAPDVYKGYFKVKAVLEK